MLKGKNIVVGITGGIAAYKIPMLIRLLKKEGANVRVIMTPAAKDFVTPLTLAALSENDVISDPFNTTTGAWNSHVALGTWADLMLFAPVTANTLGKMAHGLSDNYLLTVYLSAKCPVMIAPAMDMDMYNHPSTQQNIRLLKSYGNHIIPPREGELASGLSGPGRMEEPEKLFQAVGDFFFQGQELAGKRILVTAGPTYEKIDPVRFIGNHSSGKMGFCLAEEAAKRGGEVLLITGPVHQPVSHPHITRINVETAAEMHRACRKYIQSQDILIMAAAVADYRPTHPSPQKIKKQKAPLSMSLSPTEDILHSLAERKKKNQCFVGFALETEKELKNAAQKLANKSLDLIVVNSLKEPGSGFGSPTNKVTILTKTGTIVRGTKKSKQEVASDIISSVLDYLRENVSL